MKIIDAHMHVNLNGFNIDNLIEYLNQNGIDRCWLLTWEENNPSLEYNYQHLSIKDVLEAYDRYPDRIIPFYAPDPGDKDYEQKIISSIDKGIKGCGELKVSYKWEDKAIEQYLQTIERLHLPLVFHMEIPRIHYVPDGKDVTNYIFERLLNDKYNGVSRFYLNRIIDRIGLYRRKVKSNRVTFPGYLFDFEFLEKRIQQFPGINFIGHGPDFWNAISSSFNPKYIHQTGKIREFGIIDHLLEIYDNFYCDISGYSGYNALTRDREMANRFVDKHSDKLLFGTDNTNAGIFEVLKSFSLPNSKMDDILHLNATRIV